MGFNFNNFVHRYATKQPGITQQPHVGGTIASTLKAHSPQFSREKRLKKSLPEKKPFICVTLEDEMTVDEPVPAIQQETTAKPPQVRYKFKYTLALHLAPPLMFSLHEF